MDQMIILIEYVN